MPSIKKNNKNIKIKSVRTKKKSRIPNVIMKGGTKNISLNRGERDKLEKRLKKMSETLISEREKKFEEFQDKIKTERETGNNNSICSTMHEHSFDCLFKIPEVHKEFLKFKRNPSGFNAVKSKLTPELEGLNQLWLDKQQISIINDIIEESSSDDIGALLKYSNLDFTILLRENINSNAEHKDVQTIRIFKYFVNIVDNYQDIVELTFINNYLLENAQVKPQIDGYLTSKSTINSDLSEEEKSFRLGTVKNPMNYIGTLYEKSYVRNINGEICIQEEKLRDTYLIDYEYPNLKGKRSKKMPLYQSSGTSYNSNQKGMMSPFNGCALSMIEKFNDCKYTPFFIQLANILDINIQKKKKFFFSLCGTVREIHGEHIENYDDLKNEENIKNLLKLWYIKMSGSIKKVKSDDKRLKGWDIVTDNYNKFKSKKRNPVIDMLGLSYYKSQLLSNRVDIMYMGSGSNQKRFIKYLDNPVENTLEQIVNPRRNSELLDIFHHRFFSNRDLYSFRHMKGDPYQARELNDDYKINENIGINNIFGKDIPKVSSNNCSKEYISKKIMAFFIDQFYYGNRADSDRFIPLLEILDRIPPSKKYYLELVEDETGKKSFESIPDLEEICDILRRAGMLICNGSPSKYEGTYFYNIMKLPLYQHLN